MDSTFEKEFGEKLKKRLEEIEFLSDSDTIPASVSDSTTSIGPSDTKKVAEPPKAKTSEPENRPKNVPTCPTTHPQFYSENDYAYIPPIENPYDKAWSYLAKHNILGLFQGITSGIVYQKPGDPILFMIDEIEKIQEQDRLKRGIIKRHLLDPPNEVSTRTLPNNKPSADSVITYDSPAEELLEP